MTDERECLDVENETYATLADFIDRRRAACATSATTVPAV